jgi:hypothetical protein
MGQPDKSPEGKQLSVEINGKFDELYVVRDSPHTVDDEANDVDWVQPQHLRNFDSPSAFLNSKVLLGRTAAPSNLLTGRVFVANKEHCSQTQYETACEFQEEPFRSDWLYYKSPQRKDQN